MSEPSLRAIDAMSAPDAEARVAAANEIHRIGRALADHAVFPWWSDQELSALLDGGNPFVTIGLAVSPERFQKIREASGLPRLADVPPDQDAQEFELHLPGGISLDVLTSREPGGTGAIARYLQKFGEGIQQIELRCQNVDRATAILREKFALSPVYPATRPGANGTLVNFFLISAPKANKVLIELWEPAPHAD
jgi:hypothetical protein